jgi:hypothetical protein
MTEAVPVSNAISIFMWLFGENGVSATTEGKRVIFIPNRILILVLVEACYPRKEERSPEHPALLKI